jgi:rhodanese-related sulfurtransferase
LIFMQRLWPLAASIALAAIAIACGSTDEPCERCSAAIVGAAGAAGQAGADSGAAGAAGQAVADSGAAGAAGQAAVDSGGAGAAGQAVVDSGAAPGSDAAAEASVDAGWPPSCNGVVSGGVAKDLVARGALLIDVRTASEYAAGHVAGAINIPVDDLSSRLSEISIDRQIVVYCASGTRSARAAQTLCGAGYQVYDLGPMSKWPA